MQLNSDMSNNKLIIAAAGSGKTTHIIRAALRIKNENVLITTYTEANEAAIKKKIIKIKGYVPRNIIIQTWFSFLLQHGVRPYQSAVNDDLHESKIGFHLTDRPSGTYMTAAGQVRCYGEGDFLKCYFTRDLKIHSDKISKFIVQCNNKTSGEVVARISRIYQHIFIDEVQDLAGWDLEILKLLFSAPSDILMVGDPRQVTYLTHHPIKYKKYKDGKIKDFIETECKKSNCEIDNTSLNRSHRNNEKICEFSSKLFPEHTICAPCECNKCRDTITEHQGIFLVKEEDVDNYCRKYRTVTKLRYQKSEYPDFNFGNSKGLSFDRVLIYPTEKIRNYLMNGVLDNLLTIRSKFYVALTRAKYSVGIVFNHGELETHENIEKYIV